MSRKKKQCIPESALEPEDLVEENIPAFPPKPLKEKKYLVEFKVTLREVKSDSSRNKTRKQGY